MDPLGFGVGVAFGVALFLSGLADPDKIVGALRLKDFHAMRVIAVFVIVGMLGTWVLGLFGAAHFSVKPATLVTVLLGGSLLGIGFGLAGYCPGTGLACAAAGRLDALVHAVGMLGGALVFILVQPFVSAPLDKVVDWGKSRLPETTGVPDAVWVIAFTVVGAAVLWWTRPRRGAASAA